MVCPTTKWSKSHNAGHSHHQLEKLIIRIRSFFYHWLSQEHLICRGHRRHQTTIRYTTFQTIRKLLAQVKSFFDNFFQYCFFNRWRSPPLTLPCLMNLIDGVMKSSGLFSFSRISDHSPHLF
eukprot:Blabericola_migrator_1__4190@NODE_2283_length_3002_cov_24_327428_g1433_i0_p2_GENE_NODE_2283_length_3002_cov_24_327428_g1433_i0NODE_2283_length_3002_cov_24_327428_g1433_i0_p2_ORF_typecomplete_len122_score2_13DUF727/PF05303_12/0_094X/PF00739_19/0_13_NODE_2283_length_3002_cov_24_327428_g1433_i021112476